MINHNINPNTAGVNRPKIQPVQPIGAKPKSLFHIILRSWWIVLLTTVLGLAAALFYIDKATPIYTCTSRIYVEQSGPKIFTEIEEGVMTQSKNYLYTQATLLQSTPILTDAVENLNTQQMKTFANTNNPVGYLRGALSAMVGQKDDIINVILRSPYPDEAAEIVNTIVDSYISFNTSRKRSTSAEVLEILQNVKEKRNKELSEKLREMMEFKKENAELAFEGTQGNIVIERLDRLSTVLTEAQLATIQSKIEYESIKQIINDPNKLEQFIEAQQSNGSAGSLGSEKAELKSQLDLLKLRLADRLRQVNEIHPAVTALKTEIEKIKIQINEANRTLAQAQLSIAKQAYETAKQREQQIAEYYEQQHGQTLALNEQLAQYTILQSDWEQTKRLCEILDERIKELNVTEDVGALNISILEFARAAGSPSEPQGTKYIAIALLAGLLLGCALAILRDLIDQKLRTTEEISAAFGAPILGVVPSIPKSRKSVNRGQIVHLKPESVAAEAYRTIRTAVFFGAPNGKAKTILITSPGELEGKTTLASNLAIALAQTGQKTLLLDADFRNPMQYQIFETNGSNGLISLLSGTATLDIAIQSTEIDGLDILPCSTQLINPSEILNSESFAKLLDILSNKYDRIIIDSPPIVPVTDAQILAAICDISLLILRSEKSTRKMCQLARDGLSSVGARVLGIVVNDVPPKGLYRYYKGYNRYYSSKQAENKKLKEKKHA